MSVLIGLADLLHELVKVDEFIKNSFKNQNKSQHSRLTKAEYSLDIKNSLETIRYSLRCIDLISLDFKFSMVREVVPKVLKFCISFLNKQYIMACLSISDISIVIHVLLRLCEKSRDSCLVIFNSGEIGKILEIDSKTIVSYVDKIYDS